MPEIQGDLIDGLQTWRWAHEGSFDYPKWENHPRGPMPEKWMGYDGHYLHGNKVILSYSINKRKIIETPAKAGGFGAIIQTLRVGPGTKSLKLAVTKLGNDDANRGFLGFKAPNVKLDRKANGNIGKMAVALILRKAKPPNSQQQPPLGKPRA